MTSTNNQPTILVFGATGMVGSHAARELRDARLSVRAFVRDEGRVAALLGPDIDLAVGDLTEPRTLRRALSGVDRVLLCTANGPRRPSWRWPPWTPVPRPASTAW